MRNNIYKDKFYTHFDMKKSYKQFKSKVENIHWVGKHGFYPFIHFDIDFSKYISDSEGVKHKKTKVRNIYYAAHIDRFIYEYYGNRLNNQYNCYVKEHGINRAVIAYRNCTPGKCNIHFAREVFEFIVKCKDAYVFVGDFSQFFDRLNHKYLKKMIRHILEDKSLDDADYAIFKNITRFSYINASDIENEKGSLRRDMRYLNKYFETKEFQDVKKRYLKKNTKDYQIPQGSSISAVYANIYMIEFDKKINDKASSKIADKVYILLIISILVWMISFIWVNDLNPKYQILYLISFIAIFITGLFTIIMEKKTDYGEIIHAKVLGFKNYLNIAQKDELDTMVEKNSNYFYDILPYAYVLGVSDKWIKNFEKNNLANINLDSLKYYENDLFMIITE